MSRTRIHHRVVIVGGGTAGISVAARLRRAGVDDIAVVDLSETHYYQPLWTDRRRRNGHHHGDGPSAVVGAAPGGGVAQGPGRRHRPG